MDIRTPVATFYGDHVEKFLPAWTAQVDALRARFGEKIQEVLMPGPSPTDVPVIFVELSSIVELLSFLRDEATFKYEFLSDITATDEGGAPRFNVVYQLFSHKFKNRIRVKVRVNEEQEVPSAVKVWPGADWAEREVWDMFGIRFTGHPNLRRILMDERWEGHPLRKDYPLRGYQVFFEPNPVQEDLLK